MSDSEKKDVLKPYESDNLREDYLKLYDYALQKASMLGGILISEAVGIFAVLAIMAVEPNFWVRVVLSMAYGLLLIGIAETETRNFHHYLMAEIIREKLKFEELYQDLEKLIRQRYRERLSKKHGDALLSPHEWLFRNIESRPLVFTLVGIFVAIVLWAVVFFLAHPNA